MNRWSIVTAQWWTKTNIYARSRWLLHDAENILQYGLRAPRFGELIYVPTSTCTSALTKPYVGKRKKSGKVMKPSWAPKVVPIEEAQKVKICLRHWRDGLTWADAGAYENAARKIKQKGNADWCTTMEEVIERYDSLDTIFEIVRKQRRLNTIGSVGIRRKRLVDGILIHLDAAANPIAGGGGWHRLAMALSLNLPYFPAQIGMVHPLAIQQLHRYRMLPR